MNSFFGTQTAKSYVDGPPRQVPGYESLLRMANQLLAEQVPPNGQVLVLGAGGGLELRAFAEAQPGWQFIGVDPSSDMLKLAAQTVEPNGDRVELHQGYIDAAPQGPFDGATALLTFHFIPRDQRLKTLIALRHRLKAGAPLIVAHLSFPQTEPERSMWISRHVTFGGTAPENEEAAKEAIGTRLTILEPDEEEALLRDAGFSQISLFYAGLSIRGWVAYAEDNELT